MLGMQGQTKGFSKKKKINPFDKTITVPGDKSLSIRWVLFSSLASGISIAKNLLMSEDVLATLDAIKKLGVKSKTKKRVYQNYNYITETSQEIEKKLA